MEKKVYEAVGRRKEAVARVRMTSGKGKITVNDVDIREYFHQELLIMNLMQPLTITETTESYDIDVNVKGGGKTGQAEAIRLGIARALEEANASFRPVLKKAGFLTRNPKVKERKKPGLKKARKSPQFSKR